MNWIYDDSRAYINNQFQWRIVNFKFLPNHIVGKWYDYGYHLTCILVSLLKAKTVGGLLPQVIIDKLKKIADLFLEQN